VTVPETYLVALVCANLYFLATALSNIIYFRRATLPARATTGPRVSVIVPARNEAAGIARCAASLLAQDYADYEVIVVDDDSHDTTPDIVAGMAAREPRLRLVSAGPLPEGWLGKPHALARGVSVARGEILILTDADTVHAPQSISWAVTNLQGHRADLLSGYLHQKCRNLGDGAVVPVLYAAMMVLPFALLQRTRSPLFSFAIGQLVAVRREALEGIGGIESIRASIVDDMSLAVRMKRCGFRNVFLDASAAASCHMYDGFRDASKGIARSVYAAIGGRPLTVAAVSAVVLAFIIWPAAAVVASYAGGQTPPTAIVAAVVLFAAQWALIAWNRDMPLVAVAVYPLVFLNLVAIMNASMLGTGFGHGVDWKGRLVRMPRASDAGHKPRPVGRG